jgi:hypothetical protein
MTPTTTPNANVNTNLNTTKTPVPNPSWWTPEHETGWEKMKEFLAHEDSQTKGGTATAGTNFSASEPALRYGYGARQKYGTPTPLDWNSAEPVLAKEWKTLGHARAWEHARGDIKRGWESHNHHSRSDHSGANIQSMGSGFGASSPGDSGSGSGG